MATKLSMGRVVILSCCALTLIGATPGSPDGPEQVVEDTAAAAKVSVAKVPAPPEDLIRQHLHLAHRRIEDYAVAHQRNPKSLAEHRQTAASLVGLLAALEESWHRHQLDDRRLFEAIRRTYEQVALLTRGDVAGLDARPFGRIASNDRASNFKVNRTNEEIFGVVTEESSGESIAGVSIMIFDTDGYFVTFDTTGSDGSFRAPSFGPGRFYVVADRLGYVTELFDNIACPMGCDFSAGTPIDLAEGGSAEVPFALFKLGSIAGTITDELTGAPVNGRIEVWNTDGNLVAGGFSSGSDGIFEILGLQAGEYFIVVGGHGRQGELYDNIPCALGGFGGCDFTNGDRVTVVDGQPTMVDFALKELGSVRGQVSGADNGLGVPFVEVQFFDSDGMNLRTTHTDEAGFYNFSELVPGTYFAATFRAWTSGYIDGIYQGISCYRLGSNSQCDDLTTGTPIQVELDTTLENIDFNLVSGGKISGTVRRQDTQAPISVMEVQVYDLNGDRLTSTYVDEMGTFSAVGLETDSYLVATVEEEDYRPLFISELYDDVPCTEGLSVSCQPSEGTEVAVVRGQATGGVDFSLQPFGTISGRVSHRATGEPISNVEVSLYQGNSSLRFLSAFTPQNGEFEMAGLPAGEYFLVTHNNRDYIDQIYPEIPCDTYRCNAQAGQPITVADGTTTTGIDFSLDRGGRLRGTVTSASAGLPGSEFHPSISVYDASGRAVQSISGNSEFQVGRLLSGNYYVIAEAYDHLSRVYGSGNCSSDCDPLSGTVVAVELEQTNSDVDIVLDRLGSVAGTVTAAETGIPLGSSRVMAWTAAGEAVASVDLSTPSFELTNLNPGTYYFTAEAYGYRDQLFPGLPCQIDGYTVLCDPTLGTGFEVGLNSTTTDIDFALELEQGIHGRVTSTETGYGIAGIRVVFWTDSGSSVFSVFTGPDGVYSAPFSIPGTYFATTANDMGGIDEIFNNIQCPLGVWVDCAPTSGTPLEVASGGVLSGIDFSLEGLEIRGCQAGANSLCLADGRFEVTASWRDFEGQTGSAFPRILTDESGYFWFFDRDNVEMVVKVLDACSSFDRFWVFAAGLTNVDVQLNVRNVVSGEVVNYANPLGTPFAPILDTSAFDTCVENPTGSASIAPGPKPAPPSRQSGHRALGDNTMVKMNGCVPGGSVLCAANGRFAIEAFWRTGDGNEGTGRPVSLTDDTGYFWFFSEDNVEVIVKVLDACADPFNRFWVFSAGLTNVEVRLRVTDTQTDEVREYLNSLDQEFQPVLDTDAFATCP